MGREEKETDMQAYSRIALKVTIGVLGVAVLIPWFAAKGSYATRLTSLQQQPQVITVCPDGPPRCQFSKIQQAVDAAPYPQSPYWEPTAEIRVAPGTYEESLQIIHKVVLLRGAGKDLVFVRTPNIYPVILIAGAIGFSGTLIEGFTLKGDIGLAGGPVGAHILRNKVLGSIIVTGSIHAAIIEENDFQKGDEGCGIFALGLRSIYIQSNLLQDQCRIVIEQAKLNNLLASKPQAPGERILIKNNQGGRISIWDSSAVAIQKNITDKITLTRVEVALVEENEVQDSGIEVDGSSDVVIKKNRIERNHYGILVTKYVSDRKPAVAIVENYVVQNNRFGIATGELEYIVDCRGNEVKGNKEGDYIVGWPTNPRPSSELKDKCEKG